MSSLFEIDVDSIALLDQIQLTELLKRLLHLEAQASGIAERAVEVALNITVADGGEDGRIKWSGGVQSTAYLPARFVQFQIKATDIGPTACADELLDSKGVLKAMVEDALNSGAAYVLFNNRKLNKAQKDKRVAKMRSKLKALGKRNADSIEIVVYDANTIQSWVNKYLSTVAVVAQWVHRPVIAGMQSWQEWSRREEYQRIPFVCDDARKDAIKDIRSSLTTPRSCARIVGLSGLGKTRLALEAFRTSESYNDISTKAVYIDAAHDVPNLSAIVSDWVRHGYTGILVVDNCELSLHKRLRTEISRTDSRMSLLTLDYNLEIDETRTLRLEPLEDTYVREMLQPVYEKSIPDLHRIVAFAQGFPQMAVLLADARLNESQRMGSLTDDDLLRKMLWGSAPKDNNAHKTMAAYSLFERFGFEGEVRNEFEYIAENVAELSIDECHGHLVSFVDRGLIDTRGRFGRVIPMPLAIRLASDWWRKTRREKAMGLIVAPLPGLLSEALCERVAKLDFLPEIKELTKELCGDQGPFGQAEVILSERGSRLFRSLVETNPTVTVEALGRVLGARTKDGLRAIDGSVRRNLVWALEKLCFRKEVFPTAARLLMALAAAENERWSNNATGLFVQMFNTFLSGTEAPPVMRLALVDEAIASKDPDLHRIAVDALRRAVKTGHFTRGGGAEEQGSGKPLQEWRPQTWGDAFAYWEEALRRLGQLVEQDGEIGRLAKDAIGTSVRGLMMYGRITVLDEVIHRVVELRGRFWPEALGSIQNALNYDSDKMPPEGKQKLEEWRKLLQPTDMRHRMLLTVSVPPYEHEKDKDGHYVDLAAGKARQFAVECAGDAQDLVENFDVLLAGEQRQGYAFGRSVGELANNLTDLIENGLDVLGNIPSDKRNPTVLSAMLEQLKAKDPIASQRILGKIASNSKLVDQLPDFLRVYVPSMDDLNLLVDLIGSGKIPVAATRGFAYGGALNHLSSTDLQEFALKLSHFKPDGAWVSLDIAFMYCYGNKERWKNTKEILRTLVGLLSLSDRQTSGQRDLHQWQEIVVKLLEEENDEKFAETVAAQIISAVREGISHGATEHSVKPVIRKLFSKFPTRIWPMFSKELEDADAVRREELRHILGEFDREEGKQPTVLALPHNYLMSWCRDNREFGPKFIAGIIPIVVSRNGKWKFHELAEVLLDEFGSDPEVLRAMSLSLGSFSWSGSLVPFYERQKEAVTTVTHHQNQKVREWAEKHLAYLRDQIQKESREDEEHDWGIY